MKVVVKEDDWDVVPETIYFDRCRCGALWQGPQDVELDGPTSVRCVKCGSLWLVTEAYIKRLLSKR